MKDESGDSEDDELILLSHLLIYILTYLLTN